MQKHLISINDLSRQEVQDIFHLASEVKKTPEKFQSALRGKMFGLIFEKPSTRTWISFETGIFGLGGGTIYLWPEDIKLGVREEVKDVARVLNRYLAGVVLRTFSHETITEFGKYFQGPMVNGLSDFEHPCQALGDYFTLEERFADLREPLLAFVGDGNNVLNSLLLLAALVGGKLRYAVPQKYEPDPVVLKAARRLAEKSGASLEGSHDPVRAVENADAVYTDVWVSMGEEKLRRRKIKAFKRFQVNDTLMKRARKGAVVMHCLPAHRGEEITDGVLESRGDSPSRPYTSIVFDQAENRLHVQKAILLRLCQ